MYRKVVNYLRGSVTAQVESAYPERVLNLWGERGVPFWDLRWIDETTFTAKTTVRALPELRQAAEGIGGRVCVGGNGVCRCFCAVFAGGMCCWRAWRYFW